MWTCRCLCFLWLCKLNTKMWWTGGQQLASLERGRRSYGRITMMWILGLIGKTLILILEIFYGSTLEQPRDRANSCEYITWIMSHWLIGSENYDGYDEGMTGYDRNDEVCVLSFYISCIQRQITQWVAQLFIFALSFPRQFHLFQRPYHSSCFSCPSVLCLATARHCWNTPPGSL